MHFILELQKRQISEVHLLVSAELVRDPRLLLLPLLV